MGPAEAAAFEDHYFADDAAFAELKEAEDGLIADYLDARLSLPDRKLFESRYLRVPELKQKLDAARVARRPVSQFSFRPAWAAAAAALLLVAAGGVWYSRQERQSPPVLTARSGGPGEIAPLD